MNYKQPPSAGKDCDDEYSFTHILEVLKECTQKKIKENLRREIRKMPAPVLKLISSCDFK